MDLEIGGKDSVLNRSSLRFISVRHADRDLDSPKGLNQRMGEPECFCSTEQF